MRGANYVGQHTWIMYAPINKLSYVYAGEPRTRSDSGSSSSTHIDDTTLAVISFDTTDDNISNNSASSQSSTSLTATSTSLVAAALSHQFLDSNQSWCFTTIWVHIGIRLQTRPRTTTTFRLLSDILPTPNCILIVYVKKKKTYF
jgi:hypothetical protein